MTQPTPTIEERVTALETEVKNLRRRVKDIETGMTALSADVSSRRTPIRRTLKEITDRLDRVDPPPPPPDGGTT